MKPPEDLLSAAIYARQKAYAPYSGFKVGAALRGSVAEIFPDAMLKMQATGLRFAQSEQRFVLQLLLGFKLSRKW